MRGKPDREVARARAELKDTTRARSEERIDDEESLTWIRRPVAIRGGNLLVAELAGKLGGEVLGLGTTRIGQGTLASRLVVYSTNPSHKTEDAIYDGNAPLRRHDDLAKSRQLIRHGAPAW